MGAVATAGKVRRLLRERGWSGLPRGPRPETREHPAGLTPREVDVRVELVDGKTSIEIGEALYVSSRTVDNHVAAIIRKLGADHRRDAVRIALEHDLVDPVTRDEGRGAVPGEPHVPGEVAICATTAPNLRNVPGCDRCGSFVA